MEPEAKERPPVRLRYLFAFAFLLLLLLIWRVMSLTGRYETAIKSQPVPQVIVGAVGDISCPSDLKPSEELCQMGAVTSKMEADDLQLILALGDLQYSKGEPENFEKLFAPLWSRLKSRTRAVPGNHEYGTVGAKGYFDYWNGDRQSSDEAGERGKGYYSFDLPSVDWHLIALNSNCEHIGGCTNDSEQGQWLAADLELHSKSECTLAFWHHPRFTSGRYAKDEVSGSRSVGFWQQLTLSRADLILAGHDHIYERFTPQDAQGTELATGPRGFVVGTGGYGYQGYVLQEPRLATSEFASKSFGYLRLKLRKGSYSWQYIETNGKVLDQGAEPCRPREGN